MRELGWSRSSASDLWTGKQRYTQDHVDEVARWLGIEPFELLMPPRDARALRGMREMAHAIAAEDGVPFEPPPPANHGSPTPGDRKRRTGT